MLSFRPLWKFTAFLLPLFLGCVALGAWQLERLQWKLALIADVTRNLKEPAVPISRAFAMGTSGAQYHRFVLDGRYDNAKEVYAFGTGAGGVPVYHVITPFVLKDGRRLLVDRGLVPQTLRDPSTRGAGELPGRQNLTGVWRVPDPPGVFTPAPDLSKRIWYARDVGGIAAALHITVAAPVLIEADAAPNPGGWPKGGQTVVAFRNDHLQYAITWFALGIVIFAGWIAYHIASGRLSASRTP